MVGGTLNQRKALAGKKATLQSRENRVIPTRSQAGEDSWRSEDPRMTGRMYFARIQTDHWSWLQLFGHSWESNQSSSLCLNQSKTTKVFLWHTASNQKIETVVQQWPRQSAIPADRQRNKNKTNPTINMLVYAPQITSAGLHANTRNLQAGRPEGKEHQKWQNKPTFSPRCILVASWCLPWQHNHMQTN